jgi:hypothetical protein
VEVVAVLQKAPPGQGADPIAIPGRAQLALWGSAVMDVMAVAWMLSAGEWLDRSAPVVTLGGHHLAVLWLAAAGFASLSGMALLTSGFAAASRWHVPLLVLCALMSIVALAGVLSALLFATFVVFVLTLLGAAFLGKGMVFLGHLGGLFRR